MLTRTGWAILSLGFAAAAIALAVGCGSGDDSGSDNMSAGADTSGASSFCTIACKNLYEGCNLTIADANGNPMSQNDCASGCDTGHLSFCAGQCSAGLEADVNCSAFATCIEGCLTGGL
jgi:hypothetical protein